MQDMQEAQDNFHRSVVKFIQRQKRKLHIDVSSPCFVDLENHALYLTCHTTQVLKQLYTKRQSLERAIEAWDGCSSACLDVIKSLSSNLSKQIHDRTTFTKTLKETLQHWFSQYLRLRDGFVLLTNGECRHPTDSIEAKKAKENGYCSKKITKLARESEKNDISSYLSLITKIHSSFSFPSELDIDPANNRKDGYTKLFKSKNGYSGYGWDELFNDEVGIRYRLLSVLYQIAIFPKSIENLSIMKINTAFDRLWEEELIEKGGAQCFDIAFDEHERMMQHLKKSIEDCCDSFIEAVNLCLATHQFSIENPTSNQIDTIKHNQSNIASIQKPKTPSIYKQMRSGKIVISKDDKFERLELKEAHIFGLSEMIIQRQGDAFKVTDKYGVLPSNMNLVAWNNAMKLPNSLLSFVTSLKTHTSKKIAEVHKRSRRIIDEDSEPDEQLQTKKDITSLKVVIKEAPMSCEPPNKMEESIGDIKKQFGVDSVELERSREALEAEGTQFFIFASHQNKREALTQDGLNQALTNDITEIQDMIMDERKRVEMLKRVLHRVTDLDEIWDAQESLRESFMFLGNSLLSLHDLLSGRCDRSILLEATACFQGSITALKALREMVDSCFHGNTKEHIDFVKRTLILCRGRASTNLGRTLMERSKHWMHSDSNRIVDAVECLNDAVSCAMALRAQCVSLRTSNSEKYLNFIEIHKYEADELYSMAVKWLGLCFWQLGEKDQAIDSLLKSHGEGDMDSLPLSAALSVLHANMKCLLEKYYAASSLINLVTKEVDNSLLSKENCEHYKGLVSIAVRGYSRAMEISDLLYSVAQSRADTPIQLNDLIHEHDIVSSQGLQEMRDSFVQMWDDKSTKVSLRSLVHASDYRKDNSRDLPRSDLFPSGFMPSNKSNVKVGKFVLNKSDETSKQTDDQVRVSKDANHKRNDNSFDSFGLESTSEMQRPLNPMNFQEKVTYRLWGDDVLIALGKDIRQFPACCPVRPTT